MQVYTYSEARQKLAFVLEQAESTGKVLIRRRDGRTFALVPEKTLSSPLDVPPIKARYDKRNCGYYKRRKRKVEKIIGDGAGKAAAFFECMWWPRGNTKITCNCGGPTRFCRKMQEGTKQP
jgi:hypothetical protein